jgi:hypothetical protein
MMKMIDNRQIRILRLFSVSQAYNGETEKSKRRRTGCSMDAARYMRHVRLVDGHRIKALCRSA